ncbi:protein ycf2 [Phtheirospermum japonicum]|uniref:Protein ycf2 n=1 Tax=Phtheirospermum japonicum TaxID=374723 RepID=A0A830BSY0_9LAMI|nr:protein ycf2 [Phtheirospermum japonicum]
MHGSSITWRIRQKKWCLPQWNLISEISRSPNVWEFLYSIFFLLVAGYLVRTHLLFISRASTEIKESFSSCSEIIRRFSRKIRASSGNKLDPTHVVKSIHSKKKCLNINIIDIITNSINRITF